MCCYRSLCFQLLLLRHWHFTSWNIATHLRRVGIFSDSIIRNVLPIQTAKRLKIGQYLTKLKHSKKCAICLGNPVGAKDLRNSTNNTTTGFSKYSSAVFITKVVLLQTQHTLQSWVHSSVLNDQILSEHWTNQFQVCMYISAIVIM